MKKILSLAAVALMLTVFLCGCGKFTCDLCGEEKSGKKYKEELLGQEIVYCKDCHDGLESLMDSLG